MKLAHSYSSIHQYEECPQRFYRQRILKDVVDEGGEASIYGDRVHKYLESRIRSGVKLPAELANCEVLCTAVTQAAEGGAIWAEKELVLNDMLQPTEWWADDAWLRSKLDILIARDERAFVFDWKTGKRRPDFFQMGIFALQVFKHYPEVNRIDTALVWLQTMQMDKETYMRSAAPELLADLLGKIHRINQSADTGNWPAKPSGLCGYCPARTTCQWAQRR